MAPKPKSPSKPAASSSDAGTTMPMMAEGMSKMDMPMMKTAEMPKMPKRGLMGDGR